MDTPTTDEIRSAFAAFLAVLERMTAALEKLAVAKAENPTFIGTPPPYVAGSLENAVDWAVADTLASAPKPITYDQMREAINGVRDRRSHSVAVSILKQFCPAGTVPHMKAVKPEDYAKVLAACEAA